MLFVDSLPPRVFRSPSSLCQSLILKKPTDRSLLALLPILIYYPAPNKLTREE